MKIRIIRKMVPALIAALGLGGCVGEDIPYAPDCEWATGSPVTITVSIPGQQTPATRSIADDKGEAEVKTIDVLVFKKSGSVEVLADHAAGKITSQSTSSTDDYKVQFTAQLNTEPLATTVVILANVPAATVAAAIALTDKQDVLGELVHISSNGGGTPDGWKWKATNSTDYDPIPMYGEYDVTEGGANTEGLKSGMKMDGIDLVRMLARIDVVNNAPGFELKNVYVVNYNTAGYIAPAWGAGGVLQGSLPAIPMTPGVANPQTGEADAMDYAYSGKLVGDIYVYEAAATTGNEGDASHTEAMCLIVKGRRTGDTQDNYYRIDFTEGTDGSGIAPDSMGFNPATVSYMPVYRNYLYTFDIQAVNGAGFTHFDDALHSLGVMNNMKTNLHIVDESGINYMVFNGQHFLGVSQTEFIMPGESSFGHTLEVLTNAKDLKATVTTTDNWIKNINLVSVPGSGEKYTLTFDIGENTSGTERTGHIILTAGRLKYEVRVFQYRNCYPAYPGMIGYDPVTDRLTIDGTGFMVHFKFGGVIAMYAATNGDTWSSDDVAFNPSTKYIDTYSFISSAKSATFPAHNLTNVNTNGLGDPCRLIGLTKAEIKGGTIDNGTWRLPSGKPFENFGTTNPVYEFNGGSTPKSGGNIAKYEWKDDAKYIKLGVMTLSGAAVTTYEGTTLTIPAAGYRSNGTVGNQGLYGYSWTSTPRDATRAYFMSVLSNNMYPSGDTGTQSDLGLPVRCIQVPPTLTVSPESLDFEYGGGSKTVTVTSNMSWSVSSDQPWCTVSTSSGNGDGSLTVTTAPNGGAQRTATITVTSDDGTILRSVAVIQQYRFYPAYPGMIGYDPATDKLTIDGTGFMVYFKFGGVIAMYAAHNGDTWSSDDVAFNPSTKNIGIYSSVPSAQSATFPAQNLTNVNTNGLGDPCRLIGLTKAEIQGGTIDNGTWRLPTGNPFEDLGAAGIIYEFNGGTTPKSGGNISKYEWKDDAKYIKLGVMTLSGAAAVTTYEGTTLTIPAAGARSNGTVSLQGAAGYAWTSKPTSSVTAHAMGLQNTDMTPSYSGTGQEVGNAIRCVRQPVLPEEPYPSGGSADILYFADDGKLQVGKLDADFTRDQLAFFKFGSVVGFTYNNDAWNNSFVKFNPTQSAISSYGSSGSTTLPNIPSYASGDGNAGVEGFISSSAYHNGTNVLTKGKGDPCKLVGKTADEIRNMSVTEINSYKSGWRLPMTSENADFTGLSGAGNITWYYNSTFPYYANSSGTPTSTAGNAANPARGYFPIGGGTLASQTSGRTFNGAAAYLPATGSRHPDNGAVSNYGSIGNYWSSTASTATAGNGLNLYFDREKVIMHGNANPGYGFPIRCVRQSEEEPGGIAPKFARSNIVMYVDGSGNKILTFAETAADHTNPKSVKFNAGTTVSVPAIAANVQGLHFRFGSLVGLSSSCASESSTTFTQNDVVFWPGEYSKPATWAFGNVATTTTNQIPYGDNTIFPYNASDGKDYDAFRAKYPTGTVGYDATKGFGDICRYISDKGWVNGKWRMPTQNEYQTLFAETTVNTNYGVRFGTAWSNEAMTNTTPKYGYTPVPNARMLGAGVTVSDAADPHLANPGQARVVLPGSGYRYYFNGALYSPGSSGAYASSTLSTNSNSFIMYVSGDAASPASSEYRSTGRSVRCIMATE